MLQVHPLGKGLSDDTNLETTFETMPSGLSSNFPPLSSPLQYTPFNGTNTPVSYTNYLINLINTSSSLKGCISCKLIYHPTQHKYSVLYTNQSIDASLVRTLASTSIPADLFKREEDIIVEINTDAFLRLDFLELMSPLKINGLLSFSV